MPVVDLLSYGLSSLPPSPVPEISFVTFHFIRKNMMTSDTKVGRGYSKREHRQMQILTIGQRFFLAHGYAGTSMSAIAAELGGSKGTLWSHFASKEKLLSAVLDAATSAYHQHLSV